MFKSFYLIFLLIPKTVMAFDPFTVVNAASGVAGAVYGGGAIAGVSGLLSSASKTSGAFADLLGELDEYEPATKPDDLTTELNDIQSKALELGYDKDEIESLIGPDRDKASNLADSIHHVQRAVKVGKSLTRLFSLSSQSTAEASAVASMSTAQSSLQVQQDILAEMQKNRIDSKTSEVREDVERSKAIKNGRAAIAQNGSKILDSGVISFPPITETFLTTAIELSKIVSRILFALLTAIFLFKVSIAGLRFNSAYGELLQDSFLCAVMLLVYPFLIQVVMICANELNSNMQFQDAVMSHVPHASVQWLDKYWRSFSGKILLVEFTVFYPIIGFLFKTIICVLIAIGPLVIFLSSMLGFSFGVLAFFGLLAAFAVWPVLWNAFYAFGAIIFVEGDKSGETMTKFAGLIVWCLQFASPFFLAHFFGGQQLAGLAKGALSVPFSGLATGNARGALGASVGGPAHFANGVAHSIKNEKEVAKRAATPRLITIQSDPYTGHPIHNGAPLWRLKNRELNS